MTIATRANDCAPQPLLPASLPRLNGGKFGKLVRSKELYILIRHVSAVAQTAQPIIVGSQSLHAVTSQLPEIVRQSTECDFLFYGDLSAARERVNQTLGVFSDFQQAHGYWADALGLATVVLPPDWEQRLQPLLDEAGEIVARCVEIHDVAISKFVAGRDKAVANSYATLSRAPG